MKRRRVQRARALQALEQEAEEEERDTAAPRAAPTARGGAAASTRGGAGAASTTDGRGKRGGSSGGAPKQVEPTAKDMDKAKAWAVQADRDYEFTEPELVCSDSTPAGNARVVLNSHQAKLTSITATTLPNAQLSRVSKVVLALITPLLMYVLAFTNTELVARGSQECTVEELGVTITSVVMMSSTQFGWDTAWKLVVKPYNPAITSSRAQEIYRALQCCKRGPNDIPDADLALYSWDSVEQTRAQIAGVEGAFNDALGRFASSVAGSFYTLDDEHFPNFTDKLAQLLATVWNPRKACYGPVLNMFVDAVTGIPVAGMFRRHHGESVTNAGLAKLVPKMGQVAADRGFALGSILGSNHNQVGGLTIVKENLVTGMAFRTFPAVMAHYATSQASREFFQMYAGAISLVCGMGLLVRVANQRGPSNTGTTQVLIQDPISSPPRVLRFLTYGMTRQLVIANVQKLVVVWGPNPKGPVHPVCGTHVDLDDANAALVRNAVLLHATFVTEGQGTKDWFIMRVLMFTASQCALLLWRVLKRHPNLRSPTLIAIFRNHATVNDAATTAAEETEPLVEEAMREEVDRIAELNATRFPQEVGAASAAASVGGGDGTHDDAFVVPLDPEILEAPVESDAELEEDEGAAAAGVPSVPTPSASVATMATSSATTTSTTPASTAATTTELHTLDELAALAPDMSTPAEQPHVDQSFIPSALRSAYLATAGSLLNVVAKYFGTRFAKTDDMEAGKLNEPLLLRSIRHMFPATIVSVYSAGLVRSLEVPWAVASPDGYAVLKIDGQLVPAGIEFKTTKQVITPTGGEVKFVTCGSSDYYHYVPTRFRAQLIHQAVVTGLSHTLLVIASANMPVAVVVITYPPHYLNAFKTFLLYSPLRLTFEWFIKGCQNGKSLADVRKAMPETDAVSKFVLSSHVNRARALVKFWIALGAPLRPILYVRPYVQDLYQHCKPWVDQMSQGMLSFLGASPLKPRVGGRVVMELSGILIFAALRADRSWWVAEFFKTEPDTQEGLERARGKANKATQSFVDQAHEALAPLLSCPEYFRVLAIGAGASQAAATAAAAAAAAAAASSDGAAVTHGQPPKLRAAVQDVAEIARLQNQPQALCVYGFPIHPTRIHESASTPLKADIGDAHVARIGESVGVWDAFWAAPHVRHKTIVDFFEGQGAGIRMERKLLHVAVGRNLLRARRATTTGAATSQGADDDEAEGADADDVAASTAQTPASVASSATTSSSAGSLAKPMRTAMCLVCGKKTVLACALCGVALCHSSAAAGTPSVVSCFVDFHSKPKPCTSPATTSVQQPNFNA